MADTFEAERPAIAARLTLHEFLLENLYALAIASDADPMRALERSFERSRVLIERTRSRPSGDVDTTVATMAALREANERFFANVRRRLESAG